MEREDPVRAAFFALHRGLPREAPGSRESTARALALARPLPAAPRVLDIGCGPGMQTIDLAELLPEANVVKAFNTTFAGTLVDGEVADTLLDVFIASDDEDAKRTVSELAESSGLRPVDAGPLRRARELEALGYLHMTLQDGLGTGYGSTVKVLG